MSMQRSKGKKESAVSPVIGILLMLVVTIIIAAIVSGFAGGLSGGQQKAPQASIVAKQVIINEIHQWTYPTTPMAGAASDAFILFEHKGGDPINLAFVKIQISPMQYPHQATVISNTITPNSTVVGSKSAISNSYSKNWNTYIEAYPDRTKTILSTGDSFVLHADALKHSGTGNLYHGIWWIAETATSDGSSFSVGNGDYIVYDIIDKQSGKSISSGKVLMPDYPYTI